MNFIILLLINLVRILKFAILGRVLLSWFPSGQQSGIYRLIHGATEPILKPIRNILPRMSMIDLSPLVAYFLLDLIQLYGSRYLMSLL